MISMKSELHRDKKKKKHGMFLTFTYSLLWSQVDQDAFERLHRLSHFTISLSGRHHDKKAKRIFAVFRVGFLYILWGWSHLGMF